MALIDIMVPYYGDPEMLRDAVRSVLVQTSSDWRLVVVDDAYPDATVREWIADLSDPRVRYVRNPTNLGVNRNFQRCLDLVESPHVTFLGGDDLLLPRYVEVVTAAAARSGAAMVHPKVGIIDGRGQPTRTLVDETKRLLTPSTDGELMVAGERLVIGLVRGPWTYFPAVCWRAADIVPIGFHPGLDLTLDLRLMVEVALAGGSMLLVDDECFSYRRHPASASSPGRESRRFLEEKRFFTETASACREAGWTRAARASRGHLMSRMHAGSLALQSVFERNPSQAARLVRMALG
jgi:glycosyltransferase involved in cell wall biosynthesis